MYFIHSVTQGMLHSSTLALVQTKENEEQWLVELRVDNCTSYHGIRFGYAVMIPIICLFVNCKLYCSASIRVSYIRHVNRELTEKMPNRGWNAQLGILNWRFVIRDWILGNMVKLVGKDWNRLEEDGIGWNRLEYVRLGLFHHIPVYSSIFKPITTYSSTF